MDTVRYDRTCPGCAHLWRPNARAAPSQSYDPATYVEADFFGEDDTRSNLIRLVAERFTKIVNVPNMKDHGAAGVTGCLKNIAYGNFSNVARSHPAREDQHATRSSARWPRRAAALAHGAAGDGRPARRLARRPVLARRKFRFYPKQMMFGTDPVAIDRLLLDIIDEKRNAEHAISVWDRSPKYLSPTSREHENNPNANQFVREPGHIEFAAQLGLGRVRFRQDQSHPD